MPLPNQGGGGGHLKKSVEGYRYDDPIRSARK